MNSRKYMPARIAFVLLISASSFAQQSPQPEPTKDDKPAFQLETFYMAVMNRAEPFDGRKLESLAGGQQQFWQGVADRGDLILGGPVLVVKDTMAAVYVFRAADKPAAEKLANSDPAVKAKLWTAFVIPWGVQKDYLKPLKNYDPSVSYYLGFLKRGPKFSPEDTPERARIQEAHLKNIGRLHEMGKLVVAGPFLEDNDYRGIFVFKTATMDEANELTNTDPAVQAGRLRIELHEWKLPKEAFQAK